MYEKAKKEMLTFENDIEYRRILNYFKSKKLTVKEMINVVSNMNVVSLGKRSQPWERIKISVYDFAVAAALAAPEQEQEQERRN